jgi:hypothetical protein
MRSSVGGSQASSRGCKHLLPENARPAALRYFLCDFAHLRRAFRRRLKATVGHGPTGSGKRGQHGSQGCASGAAEQLSTPRISSAAGFALSRTRPFGTVASFRLTRSQRDTFGTPTDAKKSVSTARLRPAMTFWARSDEKSWTGGSSRVLGAPRWVENPGVESLHHQGGRHPWSSARTTSSRPRRRSPK